jgi:hypothetical protein
MRRAATGTKQGSSSCSRRRGAPAMSGATATAAAAAGESEHKLRAHLRRRRRRQQLRFQRDPRVPEGYGRAPQRRLQGHLATRPTHAPLPAVGAYAQESGSSALLSSTLPARKQPWLASDPSEVDAPCASTHRSLFPRA